MNYRLLCIFSLAFLLSSTDLAVAVNNALKQEADAKQFFPIGIFSANPPSALAELRKVGFNSVQTYRITTVNELNIYLQAAKNHGLKALVYPGMRIDENKKGIIFPERALNRIWPQIQNNDSILAWYLADEPENVGLSPQEVADFEYEIKKRDRTHKTALITGPKHYLKYKDIGDILIIDPYPIPVSPVTEVSDTMEKAKRVMGNKPVWAVIQAFDRGLFERKVQDMQRPMLGRNTAPSAEEISCMTWLAIVHGARGVFFYSFKELKYDIKEHDVIWSGVRKVVSDLNDSYSLLVSPEATAHVSIFSKQSGSSPRNIHHLFKRHSGKMYLIVVNSNNREETITFSGLPANSSAVQVVRENRILPLQNRSMTDTFKPFEVHIYEL